MADVVEQLLRLMSLYSAARQEPFGGHPLHELLRAMRASFASLDAIRAHPFLKVKAGVGQGNWAAVPWVAMLDSRETSTTQNGVYVILLFCADMTGVYLTLNQGITLPAQHLGRARARAALQSRAETIRARFPELSSLGFEGGQSMDLRTPHPLAAAYRDFSIASRFFSKADILRGDELYLALAHAVGFYERYLNAPITIDLPRPER